LSVDGGENHLEELEVLSGSDAGDPSKHKVI